MVPIRRGSRSVANAAVLAVALGLALLGGSGVADARESDRPPELRVVGGEEAQAGTAPWMVALADRWIPVERRSVFCGGVLVGTDWVVTAEHCIRGMGKKRIEAFPGALDLRNDLKRGIGVMGIRRPSIPGLDVALLHLESNSGKRPLRISGDLPDPGSLATALGWGSVRSGGRVVNRLRQVNVGVRSTAECEAAYLGVFDPATMLCAGGSGRDTCSGDSGGPLVLGGKLVGITSFGRGCGIWPGVYARVDALAPWVKAVVTRERTRQRRINAAKRAKAARKAAKKAGKRAGSARSVPR